MKEKIYFETGDVMQIPIDLTSGDVHTFKNPVLVSLKLSTGDFFAKVSTPITEDDLLKIIDTLSHACREKEADSYPIPDFLRKK